MNFKSNLNYLPEDLRRKIYCKIVNKMYLLEHKNKFKLSLNLINKKRHIIYKNLNYFKYFYKMQHEIYDYYMDHIPCEYFEVSNNEYYIYFRLN